MRELITHYQLHFYNQHGEEIANRTILWNRDTHLPQIGSTEKFKSGCVNRTFKVYARKLQPVKDHVRHVHLAVKRA